MIRRSVYLNPVDPCDRQDSEHAFRAGLTLRALRPESLPDVPGLDVACILNGRELTEFEAAFTLLKPGDHAVFAVVPHGGDDSSKMITMVASLALMIAAPAMSSALLGEELAKTALVGSLTYGQALSGVITMAGMGIMSMFVGAPKMPGFSGGDGFEQSPTYSWSVGENPSRNGHPVALVYGECHNVAPFKLASFVTTDGDQQLLNELYLLGEGPLDLDGCTDIELNGNPIENIGDVETFFRRGTGDQDVIPGFADAINERAVSQELTAEDWATFETDGNALRSLGVGLTCRRGLYRLDNSTTPLEKSVTVQIEIRAEGAAEWTRVAEETITAAKREPVRRFYRFDDLAPARYSVRCRFAEDPNPQDAAEIVSETYFDYLHEIVPEAFNLPHSALLAIRALPTEKISGGRPQMTCTLKRSFVDVWEPDSRVWTSRPANLPAWAAYDAARNPRSGAGVPVAQLVFSDFERAANWESERNISGSLYLDSEMDLGTLAEHFGAFGRFKMVQRGTRVGLIVDARMQGLPSQGLTVTTCDIVRGTFGLEYLSCIDRVDAVEVTFFPPESQRNTLLVRGEHFSRIRDRQPNVLKKTLYFCNDAESAQVFGEDLLAANRYCGRTATMTLGTRALACGVGDYVQVSHDRIGWGQSALLLPGSGRASLLLNRPVSIEAGRELWAQVTHADRVDEATGELLVEAVALVNYAANVETDALVLAGNLKYAPSENSTVKIAEILPGGLVSRLFRVINVKRTQAWRHELTVLEYHPEIHEQRTPQPWSVPGTGSASISGLVAGIFERSEEGLTKKIPWLSWRGNAFEWTIFGRRLGESVWKRLGTTNETTFDVRRLEAGFVYEFAVSGTGAPGGGASITLDYSLDAPVGVYDRVTAEIDGTIYDVTAESGGTIYDVTEV